MPPTASNPDRLRQLQTQIWQGSLPLEIHLSSSDCRTYNGSQPYLIQYPRLSYLAFLLPRLHSYFRSELIHPEVSHHDAWFSFENVPMKWHYPLGLLYDVFSGTDPVGSDQDGHGNTTSWKLTVHFTDYPHEQLVQLDPDGRTMLDAFINSVKEADFIRNGTARAVMSLSKDDSDSLWDAVKTHNMTRYTQINSKLLSPPGVTIKHVPFKIYLPTSSDPSSTPATIPEEGTATDANAPQAKPGHIRVVQALMPLQTSSRQPQTVGTALNSILPTIFPSRRNPLLAQPVLHGTVVPMGANLAELGRAASYCDGFLHFGIVMMS
ncbi:autophagy protein 5 [Polychaeton citri CBS 116435]|uniref:Autophagy protein 5 n=1 Tax=Polychaeton citri CBS 116435 TaxID=1314669 RepID=A0A9P4UU99_9PEZI|nr:autophagy protein 5 [Polychaeton citri CBS 116435]